MKKFTILSILMLFWTCKEKCTNPLYFQVGYAAPGTSIILDVDSGQFKKNYEFSDGFYMTDKNRFVMLDGYCSREKKVLVKAILNQRSDTTFSVNPQEIRGCFLGENIDGEITVVFDYYKGGLRQFGFD